MIKILIIIPARFKSSRFPGKPLADILGKPMVIRVAEIAKKVKISNKVIIATDSKKIASVCKQYNYEFVMTSKKCLTGTDRLSEVARKIKAEMYINLQGDEPIVSPKDIEKVIKSKIKNKKFIICGYTKIRKDEKSSDNSIPKVVFNKKKELIYLSRAPIPGSKGRHNFYFKQVCIYAFNRGELVKFSETGRKSYIENIEDIELLRYFDLNKKIKMVQVSGNSIAVDFPKDIKKVENILKKRKKK